MLSVPTLDPTLDPTPDPTLDPTENCGYTMEALRATFPPALASVSSASILHYYDHCVRIMDAYHNNFTYGTKEFQVQLYKNHRQVADKSKW